VTTAVAMIPKSPKRAALRSAIWRRGGSAMPSESCWDASPFALVSHLPTRGGSGEVASGMNQKRIEDEWKDTGDLGITSQNLIKNKTQATLFSQNLAVKKVFSNLRKLAEMGGQGTVDQKVKLIAELLSSAQPDEARYIVRTVLEELRVGIAEGAIRDAITWAYFPKVVGVFFRCSCGEIVPATKFCMKCGEKVEGNAASEIKNFSADGLKALSVKDVSELKDIEDYDLILPSDEKVARDCHNYLVSLVEGAYEILNDFGEVARIAKEEGRGGLLNVKLTAGRPVKLMLYPKANDIDDAFKKLGKPCAFEYKYDGFRIQVHKNDGKVDLYTRRLENVSKQFPEVVGFVEKNIKGASFIIDSEAVGFDPKTKKYLPFQSISQRIKRKYDIDDVAKKFPVELNIFDILYQL